ncbi:MAG TPA: tetratricopeptide repeat protein [candidate division Zixibacteria bacterium]|nr:tetratricopeptide repeat protein [candidate division Zixibacteria bacterium]
MRKQVMKYALLVGLVTAAVSAQAETFADLVRRGNEAANTGDFQKALNMYRDAETERPESPELEYNIGGALYGAGDYEQAAEHYAKAFETEDIQQEGRAHYNLGNTYFRQSKLDKAIEEYQKYLEINPDDEDAKFNLELSRKLLKEQMKPQEQQQQQKNDQQQQQQQDSTQQQQQQQGQEQQKDSTQQQQQPDQNQGQDSTQQQQQPQPNDQQQGPQDMEQQQMDQQQMEMSKEDAERILNAIRDDEQEVQKNLKKPKIRGNYRSSKDW